MNKNRLHKKPGSISLKLIAAFRPLQILICILNIFYSLTAFSQITIIIDSLPSSIDYQKEKIYVAGNFNNWNPSDDKYIMRNDKGKYSITFTPQNTGPIEFKFTRGGWETGEVLKNGGFQPNHTYRYHPGLLVHEKIQSWQDVAPEKVNLPNTEIIVSEIFSPELNINKTIRILLPDDYKTSGKRYSVIYMLDGQNLFDDVYSFAGEWGIDESMKKLADEKYEASIVVGIDHAGDKRLTEYSPWINEKYGGGLGDEFADFLVQSLKPEIDKTYRTISDREHTCIMGSSMGGLMSLYIVLQYNNVFAKAGVFSPAFWFSHESMDFAVEHNFTAPTKIYFIAGGMEGKEYIDDMEVIYDILINKNYAGNKYRFVIESDGSHTESFWRSEFPLVYTWLTDN